ncbi:MAG: DUF3014 domain-containing protein [Halieaceae bacterium]|jgi:hypothetical protein|nr:DUF3014 domain-containing protein [Halieaceae bacterium]
MKAVREDRLEGDSGRGGFPLARVTVVLALIVAAFLLWRSLGDKPVEVVSEPVAVEEIALEPPPLPPAEDIPPRPEPVVEAIAEAPAEPSPPPLPPLTESDEVMRAQMEAAGVAGVLAPLEQQQNLIQQGTALIDGLSRGVVLRKLLPLDPPSGDFTAIEEGDQIFMNPASYQRYDSYAQTIASLDTGTLVDSFHTLRPLYEEAYGQLGLNPDDFDNALIRALDRVLATPEIEGPIALTHKSVMYKYADPQLEQLTPMQKQLLRMGPDNLRRIKEQARSLREGLLNQQ